MSKREQRIGAYGQERAAIALRNAGVQLVERIATPVKLIPARQKGTFKVIYGETVSGDHRGILPNGISVLAETKTVLDGNLTWSHLRDHQPGRLTAHADCNGVSLLVWVHTTGIYIMRWPIEGFGPRKSITLEKAIDLHINSTLDLQDEMENER
jgi:hypothetical protein